jgi:hypothetical protein
MLHLSSALRAARGSGRHARASPLRLITSTMPLVAAGGSHHDQGTRWGAAASTAAAAAAALVSTGSNAQSDEGGDSGSSSDAARWQKVVDASIPAVVVIEVGLSSFSDLRLTSDSVPLPSLILT